MAPPLHRPAITCSGGLSGGLMGSGRPCALPGHALRGMVAEARITPHWADRPHCGYTCPGR